MQTQSRPQKLGDSDSSTKFAPITLSTGVLSRLGRSVKLVI